MYCSCIVKIMIRFFINFLLLIYFCFSYLQHWLRFSLSYLQQCKAMLAGVPWIPGNPIVFKQWVPEPINFGKKGQKCTPFSDQNKKEIKAGTLKQHLKTHQFDFLAIPLCINVNGSHGPRTYLDSKVIPKSLWKKRRRRGD